MLNLRTERLRLRPFALDDAPFILELLNEPAFHRFIGDRQVRTEEQARDYLERGPLASYTAFQFGLCAVLTKTGKPAGMCGILKRDGLEDPDLGFAFLARYWGRGYAQEAAEAVLAFARDARSLPRVAAITDPANRRSIRLLERLGMKRIGPVQLPDGDELLLFRIDFGDA